MWKRSTFTTVSPLPAGIPRAAAVAFLHDHEQMIDLNPLVVERHPIAAPAHAAAEERDAGCAWWALTDRIAYLPGGAVSGDVAYTAAFHDLAAGVQTHCYAPMGTDIRSRWSVAGSLPGEPPEPVELGLGAPRQGLYLREDVELRCNFVMTPFVKKTLKKAHGHLVDQLVEKARLQGVRTSSTAPPQPASSSHRSSGLHVPSSSFSTSGGGGGAGGSSRSSFTHRTSGSGSDSDPSGRLSGDRWGGQPAAPPPPHPLPNPHTNHPQSNHHHARSSSSGGHHPRLSAPLPPTPPQHPIPPQLLYQHQHQQQYPQQQLRAEQQRWSEFPPQQSNGQDEVSAYPAPLSLPSARRSRQSSPANGASQAPLGHISRQSLGAVAPVENYHHHQQQHQQQKGRAAAQQPQMTPVELPVDSCPAAAELE
ncbi:hypothetical protein GGR56DRAFT_326395 [Xylariaceae sp. FL0804]|nr:hypothetical protein GGR56DRAFT_326395 [Xylariaceae sp. FL0804]